MTIGCNTGVPGESLILGVSWSNSDSWRVCSMRLGRTSIHHPLLLKHVDLFSIASERELDVIL